MRWPHRSREGAGTGSDEGTSGGFQAGRRRVVPPGLPPGSRAPAPRVGGLNRGVSPGAVFKPQLVTAARRGVVAGWIYFPFGKTNIGENVALWSAAAAAAPAITSTLQAADRREEKPQRGAQGPLPASQRARCCARCQETGGGRSRHLCVPSVVSGDAKSPRLSLAPPRTPHPNPASSAETHVQNATTVATSSDQAEPCTAPGPPPSLLLATPPPALPSPGRAPGCSPPGAREACGNSVRYRRLIAAAFPRPRLTQGTSRRPHGGPASPAPRPSRPCAVSPAPPLPSCPLRLLGVHCVLLALTGRGPAPGPLPWLF